jgi:hypothetical protein
MVTVILEKNNEAIKKKQETATKVPTLKSVWKEAFLNHWVQRPMRLFWVRSYGRKKIQANPREPWRIVADNEGNVITFITCYIRKYLMLKYLEARRVEPLFR